MSTLAISRNSPSFAAPYAASRTDARPSNAGTAAAALPTSRFDGGGTSLFVGALISSIVSLALWGSILWAASRLFA